MIAKRNVSYPEFEKYCEQIKSILISNFNEISLLTSYQLENDYENMQISGDISNQRQMLFLSNGDVFKYFVPKSSIAHLLGINTEYLKSTSLFFKNDSYGILLELISNPYKYYQKYKEGLFDINMVISPYIDIKIESFLRNIEININECEFICKYKKNRSYGYGQNDMLYLVLTKHDDKYYVLMLEEYKDFNNILTCVPRSNRRYDSMEEVEEALSSILYNQELTMLNGKSIKFGFDNSKRFWINSQNRIKKLDGLNIWAKKLDCIPNVINDYVYLVNKFTREKTDKFYKTEILGDISNYIRGKKIIDIDISSLSSDVIEIINAYNDSLDYGNNDENEIKFSDLLSAKNTLEQQLEQALKEKEELQSKLSETQQQYADSVQLNEQLTSKLENVRKALG